MTKYLMTIEVDCANYHAAERVAREMADEVAGEVAYVRSVALNPTNREALAHRMADHLDDEVRKAKHPEDWEGERVAWELLGMAEAVIA